MRADEQKPDMSRERRTSSLGTAKSISIKGAERRFGGCAWKAVELTSGDLCYCSTPVSGDWADRKVC
jgi:hypothetical protein